jgi:hypothetical protein
MPQYAIQGGLTPETRTEFLSASSSVFVVPKNLLRILNASVNSKTNLLRFVLYPYLLEGGSHIAYTRSENERFVIYMSRVLFDCPSVSIPSS